MAITSTYRTLEEDLTYQFNKRNIDVISISVTNGATIYTIKVNRKENGPTKDFKKIY